MRCRRVLLVAFALLAATLGWCIGVDAHHLDLGAQPAPCEVGPVSIKPGAERIPSAERTVPVLMPSVHDTTVVWHCGPPDAPLPPVIAVAALSVRPYVPRAPPRG
jgi:hypothetical protein